MLFSCAVVGLLGSVLISRKSLQLTRASTNTDMIILFFMAVCFLKYEFDIDSIPPDRRKILEIKSLVVDIAKRVGLRVEVGIFRNIGCIVPKVATNKVDSDSFDGRFLQRLRRKRVA